MTNLYLAYAATWVIHLCYLLYLNGKARRLRREGEELAAERRPR